NCATSSTPPTSWAPTTPAKPSACSRTTRSASSASTAPGGWCWRPGTGLNPEACTDAHPSEVGELQDLAQHRPHAARAADPAVGHQLLWQVQFDPEPTADPANSEGRRPESG